MPPDVTTQGNTLAFERQTCGGFAKGDSSGFEHIRPARSFTSLFETRTFERVYLSIKTHF